MTRRTVLLPALLAAAIGACLATLLAVSGKAEAAFPGANGKIAFAAEPCDASFGCDGDSEIFTLRPDGSGRRQLTDNGFFDYSPNVSPDGRRIAFASERFGDVDIYTMSPSGGGVKNLTKNSRIHDNDPAWSPDGSKIAFSSYRDGSEGIYAMNADGTGVNRIARYEDPDFFVRELTWSPDGAKIAFTGTTESDSGESNDVYVASADGSGQTARLTDGAGATYNECPSWSPDGSKIAFTSSTGGNYEVFVMDADGTDERNLTDSADASEYRAAWSPDGRRMAYAVLDPAGKADLWVMNADGSGRKNITDAPTLNESEPDWGPKTTTTP